MKISWNWLCEYIESDAIHIDDLASILTSTGLEVEGMEKFESIKGGLEKFYIGEVLSCVKHPNADKLSLTEVDLGAELGIKKIVCGAPNVAAGQRVVVATEGAVIYMEGKDPFEIKNSKIRGEESQGMICAEDELGIGTSHDGILVLDSQVPIGIPAAAHFGISTDTVFEIGLTPNRTDAMSHRGVARDLAAALTARGIAHQYYPDGKSKFELPSPSIKNEIKVELKTPDCYSFYTSAVQNIDNTASPTWIANRLKSIGENPKNIIVDLTNYILHDLGQPLHAYDADRLSGSQILVSSQTNKEEMIALNSQKYNLESGDIVISDSEKKIGLAGIMGSESSAVLQTSKNIVFEAAHFSGTAIRTSSQRLNLRSEASAKFEKGINPNAVKYALEKAMRILNSLSPSAKFSEINETIAQTFENYEVRLTSDKLNMYANMSFEREKVEEIVRSLGIEVKTYQDGIWTLSIPRFKDDVTREEDVIEEVLRIYGYNQLPYPKYLKSNLSFSNGLSIHQFESNISNVLIGSGFQEIMTNSISQSRYFPNQNPIMLLNSMTSELDCMRTDMVPSMLEVVEYNANRDQRDLNLFEIGNEYFLDKNSKYAQRKRLVIIITGQSEVQNWQKPKGAANDYFQLKSIVERLAINLNLNISFAETKSEKLSYGLDIILNQKTIGCFGLAKFDSKLFSIKQQVFIAELDMDYLYSFVKKSKKKYTEVSKFPAVKRDLAMVLEDNIQFSQIEKIAYKSIGGSLTDIGLFDIFKGESIGKNKKSYAVRCSLQNAEKTMSDKEIDSLMQKFISSVQKELNAEIRS